jgi:hypothetical protein
MGEKVVRGRGVGNGVGDGVDLFDWGHHFSDYVATRRLIKTGTTWKTAVDTMPVLPQDWSGNPDEIGQEYRFSIIVTPPCSPTDRRAAWRSLRALWDAFWATQRPRRQDQFDQRSRGYLLDLLDRVNHDPPKGRPRHLGYGEIARVLLTCYHDMIAQSGHQHARMVARCIRSVLPNPIPDAWTDGRGYRWIEQQLRHHRRRNRHHALAGSRPESPTPLFAAASADGAREQLQEILQPLFDRLDHARDQRSGSNG